MSLNKPEYTRKGIKLPYDQKFGKLQLLGELREEGKKVTYLWQCECGKQHRAALHPVMNYRTLSCGCFKKEIGMSEMNAKYKGKKYNMLTYKEHAGKWGAKVPGKLPIAIWTCDCGNEIESIVERVLSGRLTCCGCATGRDGGESDLGKKWNNLTLVELAGKTGSNNRGKFLCDCGKTIYTSIPNVKNGRKKSCGCLMSKMLRDGRGFTLDESKFETITNESAYWIGFLLADGNVSKNVVAINLKTSDVPHLEKFREFMGGNQAISLKKDNRVSGYAFGSIKVVKDLAQWGIVPNKSLIATAHPDLDMNPHFWRGVVDGDGTITKTAIGLCGTKSVCESFLRFCKSIINTDATVQQVKENLYHTRIGVSRDKSSELARLMYDNPHVHLDRKYDLVMTILNRVERVANEGNCPNREANSNVYDNCERNFRRRERLGRQDFC